MKNDTIFYNLHRRVGDPSVIFYIRECLVAFFVVSLVAFRNSNHFLQIFDHLYSWHEAKSVSKGFHLAKNWVSRDCHGYGKPQG